MRHVIHVSPNKPTPDQVRAAVATIDEPVARWTVHRMAGAWYVTVVTR